MGKYGVYIIESLKPTDHRDGKILHDILQISGISTKYTWTTSILHFKKCLLKFQKSKFKYLHISCHADGTGIDIGKDSLDNEGLQSLTMNMLFNKRVFLSTCKGGNRDLASRLIIKNQAMSVIGMPIKLRFDKSVVFWPAFYHLINELDSKRMKREGIVDIMKKCVSLYQIPVNYYSKIANSKGYLRRLKIREDGTLDNRKIKAINC